MTWAEDFMLLALREEDGKPLIGYPWLECGLAAAVLLELADAGRIEVAGDRLVVCDRTPLGVPEEDAALARLVAEEPQNLQWWVRSLRVGLYERILARLVARDVVAERRDRFLGVFPAVHRSLTDGAPGRELRERLSELLHSGPADPRSVALLTIAHATALDRVVFPAVDATVVERRIRELGEDGMAEAVADVVRGLRAAVIVAVTAAG